MMSNSGNNEALKTGMYTHSQNRIPATPMLVFPQLASQPFGSAGV